MKTTVFLGAAAVGALIAGAGFAAEGDTLAQVKARGELLCGVNPGLVGFASPDANGNWSGFDISFCKAVAAAVLGDGDEGAFYHDDTVFITHAAERCESRQVYKKVLKNGAQGIFQGKILVKPGAQKTDGYQISQGLLLDEGSQFLAKPELEIYADDVKCSHGSTTGALDETALFYLRSRGVPKEQAIVLLVLSFLADALDEIEDERLRDDILTRLDEWLTSRAKA